MFELTGDYYLLSYATRVAFETGQRKRGNAEQT
jgi:hypothetical protein